MFFSKINITLKKILLSSLLKNFISDVFYVSFFTFFVYLILEILAEGIISNYFDLNKFLVLVICFGILKLILDNINKPIVILSGQYSFKFHLFLRLLFAIIMTLLIYLKLNSLGLIALLISLAAGLVIFLASEQKNYD